MQKDSKRLQKTIQYIFTHCHGKGNLKHLMGGFHKQIW